MYLYLYCFEKKWSDSDVCRSISLSITHPTQVTAGNCYRC